MAKTSKLKIWLKRIFYTLLSLVALFLLVIVPTLVSHLITHSRSRPQDLQLTSSPADYNIAFREVSFSSAASAEDDSLVALQGWAMPQADHKGVIVYAHGLFRSRQEVLARAAAMHKLGYSALAFDFRRHGKSGAGVSSVGYRERHDVLGAVQFARDSLAHGSPVIAYGVSMGAAATLLAMAEKPLADALIVDSSFLSFQHTVFHHLKQWLGIPRFPIGDLIVLFTRWRVGFSNDAFNMLNAVAKIDSRPVLFFAADKDRRMPVAVARQLYEAAASSQKNMIIIEDATHGAGFRTAPEKYTNAIETFLDRNLLLSSASASAEDDSWSGRQGSR